MRRTIFLLAPLLAAVQLAMPAVAIGEEATRVSFLAADTGYLYWSPDANDPELTEDSVTRVCGVPPLYGTAAAAPCLSGVEVGAGFFTHSLFFAPAALFAEDISWTHLDMPTFRVEVAVEPAVAYTVHVVIQNGTTQTESTAATEVAPGVFEGEIPPREPISSKKTTLIGVRVRSRLSRVTFTVNTAGASYVDFPSPISMRTVPELLATPGAVSPLYSTPQRFFEFNDADYQVHEFSGDLSQLRRFTINLPASTPVVYAWVESFLDPLIADTVRSGSPDARRFRDAPRVSLSLNGEQIASGANSAVIRGRGMDTVAAVNVGPGTLVLDVYPSSSSAGGAYTARILTAGERTLSRIRWQSAPVDNEPYVTNRLPGLGICPSTGEVVPVTPAVGTFRVDLSASTVNPLPERWTLRYTLPDVGAYGCGEGGMGNWIRFTTPQAGRVWSIGAVPPRDINMVSLRMTTFTFEVKYTYA